MFHDVWELNLCSYFLFRTIILYEILVMLALYKDWSDLFKNILWSDEAVFHIGESVNRHNCDFFLLLLLWSPSITDDDDFLFNVEDTT